MPRAVAALLELFRERLLVKEDLAPRVSQHNVAEHLYEERHQPSRIQPTN